MQKVQSFFVVRLQKHYAFLFFLIAIAKSTMFFVRQFAKTLCFLGFSVVNWGEYKAFCVSDYENLFFFCFFGGMMQRVQSFLCCRLQKPCVFFVFFWWHDAKSTRFFVLQIAKALCFSVFSVVEDKKELWFSVGFCFFCFTGGKPPEF